MRVFSLVYLLLNPVALCADAPVRRHRNQRERHAAPARGGAEGLQGQSSLEEVVKDAAELDLRASAMTDGYMAFVGSIGTMMTDRVVNRLFDKVKKTETCDALKALNKCDSCSESGCFDELFSSMSRNKTTGYIENVLFDGRTHGSVQK